MDYHGLSIGVSFTKVYAYLRQMGLELVIFDDIISFLETPT